MTRDELEFRISRYLDGDLPPEQRIALEAQLGEDSDARSLYEELKAVNDLLKGASSLPAVRWDRLGDTISAAVSEQHLERSEGSSPMRLAADDASEEAVIRSLTGDLTSDQQRQLDRLIETDPAVRDLAAQHRALDVSVRHGLPLPHVDFDRLASRIGHAVAAQQAQVRDAASGDATVEESLEQSLVELVDGELPIAAEADVTRALETDASARCVLRQHRSVEVLLKHGMPLPHVDWDLLQSRISGAVAHADRAANEPISLTHWRTTSARVAVAAIVMLACAAVVWLMKDEGRLTTPNGGGHSTALNDGNSRGTVLDIIAVDNRPTDAGSAGVIQISVGPSPEVAGPGSDFYAAGAVVSQPARVLLAERMVPTAMEDGMHMPF